jgi:hypothetical protein
MTCTLKILQLLVLFISSFIISLFSSLLVCPSFLCPNKLASIMAKPSNYYRFMTKLMYVASHRVLTIDPLHGLDTWDIIVLVVTSINFIVEIHWTCMWMLALFNMLLNCVSISPGLGFHLFMFFDMLLELQFQ